MELTRIRIALLSALSAATGYIAFARGLTSGVITASLGLLLLAMGACALNQFQDRDIDARMERTHCRPIPSGAVTPATAVAIALSGVGSGFALLWFGSGAAAALIGLLAVAWYNGVYTPLKRISAFAVIPGALVGALPPVLGWTAAGGNTIAPPALALAFFFFIWQVPHFWLLLFVYGNDFERAGLPSLTRLFNTRQLTGLAFMWMLTTSVSSLLLPVYLLTSSPWIGLGLIACGSWFAWEAAKLLRGFGSHRIPLSAFRSINLYALCVMVLLIVDAVL